MAFKADPAALKGLAAGDKVSFSVKGQQITAIRKH
jgi:predicted lysophospholipase L1 biosynthesis ABC-type transport system permease subunit